MDSPIEVEKPLLCQVKESLERGQPIDMPRNGEPERLHIDQLRTPSG
jgi:hypothetical protein